MPHMVESVLGLRQGSLDFRNTVQSSVVRIVSLVPVSSRVGLGHLPVVAIAAPSRAKSLRFRALAAEVWHRTERRSVVPITEQNSRTGSRCRRNCGISKWVGYIHTPTVPNKHLRAIRPGDSGARLRVEKIPDMHIR